VFYYDGDADSMVSAGDAFILAAEGNLPPMTLYELDLAYSPTGSIIATSTYLTEPVVVIG
jgi:hypothetical protein